MKVVRRNALFPASHLAVWLSAGVLTLGAAVLIWLNATHRAAPATSAQKTAVTKQLAALDPAHGPVHSGIMTTVFWVGEPADADNANISNAASAWDEQWQAHFGGFDDPDHRSGFDPSKFTPAENPFYFALPYNDFITSNGTHKPTANGCLNYTSSTNDRYSWCKNDWIAIVYGGKTVYAQWEDVGPNGEDDSAYVFGTNQPKNTFGAHAGLDVSPAVRDYLGLDGDNRTTWAFMPASAVPDGPWKTHVTTNPGDSLY